MGVFLEIWRDTTIFRSLFSGIETSDDAIIAYLSAAV